MPLTRVPLPTGRGLALPAILVLALALRLAALAVPAVAYPDEVFQYLEPAHRLVFGYGVTTWEWRHGMRGWLIPLLLAAPMWLGGTLAPASAAYLVLPKLLTALLSLAPVAACWSLGARLSRLHGVFAGLAAALWYESVYYAPHALSETLAIDAILPAAALLLDAGRDARRLAAAGALLALAASLRFQYAPAIAVLVIAAGWRLPARGWVALLAGAAAGSIPSALADAAMGQMPFAWIVENVRQNMGSGQADRFGTSTVLGFLAINRPRWSVWIVPALWLGFRGARRYPALGWCALANFAVHMALAHKEYRFVLLSAAILVLLAAIGTIDTICEWSADPAARRRRLRLFAGLWLIADVTIAAGSFRDQWQKYRPQLDPAIMLRHDPALCGFALYAHDYSTTGAYTYLHRDVPMLYFGTEEGGDPASALHAETARFNTILADPARSGDLPPGYTAIGCGSGGSDRTCLYRRPGACAPGVSRYAIDLSLTRIIP